MRVGALQLSNPDYQHELADWTHRPPWNGDGVPLSTTVDPVPQRVPVRDFAPFGGDTMPAGIDNDQVPCTGSYTRPRMTFVPG